MSPHLLRQLKAIQDHALNTIGASIADRHLSKPPVMIGLIGAGIGASRSPAMHEGEGRHHGIPYAYERIDSDRLGFNVSDLPDILGWAEQAGFTGLNVTYPFKQTIIPHLNDLSVEAEAMGAVNTVVFRDGRRSAFNTDTTGFADSFRRELSDAPRRRVVQIGAGGAGAAVALALANLGAERIAIFDLDVAKTQTLVARLGGKLGAERFAIAGDLDRELARADGLVNATPVGMAKYPGLPLDRRLLRPDLWVADVVYFPRQTELLATARAIGCRTLSGVGMAVFQAVHAFKHFCGGDADPERMLHILEQEG